MIAFENAALGYPGKTVFANLNWTLPHRGTIALMGPSGGGKTTLLRALAGLLPPLSGRVEGLGNKKIAVLFQEDRLLPWLTAEKNAALAGGLAGARHWLAQMEIDAPGQYPREMSGGMQRRAALARAMNYGGDLLLLDEPFKGLDETLRARIAGRIRNQAPLIVLAIHDPREAELMGAEIIRLEDIKSGRTPSL